MTREMNPEASGTWISPNNIIRRQLSKHEADVRCYQLNRPAARKVIKELKSEPYPDDLSIKAAQERLTIWNKAIRWFELLGVLADRIDSCNYKGQQLTLLTLVKRLGAPTKENEWRQALNWFGIDVHAKIWFGVGANIDIESIENELKKLLGESNWVLAEKFKEVVQSDARSKVYRDAKVQLELRGWCWVQKRMKGQKIKVIEYRNRALSRI
jgi:hypothetical protein